MPIENNQFPPEGGGTIVNEQGPPWPPSGPGFTSIPINTLLNRSGIVFDVAHEADKPFGWHELDGYKETFRDDELTAVRIFQGPWGYRLNFKNWVLGFSDAVSDGAGGGKIIRYSPTQHPEMPFLYAVSCDLVHGQGAWGQNPFVAADMIAYSSLSGQGDLYSCVYAVTYRNLPFSVRSEQNMLDNPNLTELHRYCERSEVDSYTTVSIPGYQLFFVTDPTRPIAEAAGNRIFPTSELLYNFHEWPDIPEDGWQACRGRVNADNFDAPVALTDGSLIGGLSATGYPPETLLCMGFQKTIYRTRTGRVNWRFQLKFMRKQELPDETYDGSTGGWNYFPRVTPAGVFQYERATFKNGVPQYPLADFTQLYTPPAPKLYDGPIT